MVYVPRRNLSSQVLCDNTELLGDVFYLDIFIFLLCLVCERKSTWIHEQTCGEQSQRQRLPPSFSTYFDLTESEPDQLERLPASLRHPPVSAS